MLITQYVVCHIDTSFLKNKINANNETPASIYQRKDLTDFKFYCFDGNPMFCQVISDRNTQEIVDFFDMQWRHQDFTGVAFPHKPFSSKPILPPVSLQKMIKAAKVLSRSIPFVRVDFYEIDGKMFFGELTFFPAGGFGSFEPDKWNYILGDAIVID